MMVSDLLNDYGTMVANQFGEYVDNNSVMESWERTDNDDGSATYTIKIKEGLVYNNGEEITAKDYTVRTMLGCSAAATGLGVQSASASMIVGAEEYNAGEVDFVSGIRIIDDYTLSLQIVADYANYYYADTYAAVAPWSPSFWFGEGWDVADNGEGTAFTFNGEVCQLDKDAVLEHFNSSKNGSRGEFVSAGPYNLVKFDQGSGQVTLTINPLYVGNFEGQKPSIETLVITKAETATWADAMKTGALDLYENITDGVEINTVLDMIDEGYDYQYVQFDRAGYGKLQFFCDVTPTQFIEVRHAVAMLLDRVAFADTFCEGWGSVVDGPYAPCLYQ
jgi:peptide/nickel transport system substrate-binding protein